MIPSRITTEFTTLVRQTRLKTSLVFHINHKNEISKLLTEKCQLLKQAGVHLFNQAVLLKGINDTVDKQVELSEALFAADILPYYLHLLDKVEGALHFDSPEQHAKAIYQGMLAELPGFLVPKLVREIGGETSKTPILPY